MFVMGAVGEMNDAYRLLIEEQRESFIARVFEAEGTPDALVRMIPKHSPHMIRHGSGP